MPAGSGISGIDKSGDKNRNSFSKAAISFDTNAFAAEWGT